MFTSVPISVGMWVFLIYFLGLNETCGTWDIVVYLGAVGLYHLSKYMNKKAGYRAALRDVDGVLQQIVDDKKKKEENNTLTEK